MQIEIGFELAPQAAIAEAEARRGEESVKQVGDVHLGRAEIQTLPSCGCAIGARTGTAEIELQSSGFDQDAGAADGTQRQVERRRRAAQWDFEVDGPRRSVEADQQIERQRDADVAVFRRHLQPAVDRGDDDRREEVAADAERERRGRDAQFEHRRPIVLAGQLEFDVDQAGIVVVARAEHQRRAAEQRQVDTGVEQRLSPHEHMQLRVVGALVVDQAGELVEEGSIVATDESFGPDAFGPDAFGQYGGERGVGDVCHGQPFHMRTEGSGATPTALNFATAAL